MQILVLIGVVGASSHMGEMLPLSDFFDCPVLSFFSGTRQGRTAEPIFTLYGSNDVFPRKEVSFGLKLWVTLFGGNMPQPPPPPIMTMNRQFQAKTPKYKNRNISKTVNPIKTKFEQQAETNSCTSC